MSLFGAIKHPKKRAFLAAFSECGEVKGAAEAAGISRELHYDWLQHDNAYALAFRVDATELAGDALEDEARRRAKSSDKVLMFLLRGLKPEKYGTQKVEHAGQGGAPISINVRFV